MTELVFSYGTLRLPKVLRATFGREVSGRRDSYEVDDYRRIAVPLRSGATAWVYVFAG